MHIKEYFSDLVALFYPELCTGCNEPLPKGVQHVCVKCRYDLAKTGNHKLEIDALTEKFKNIVSIRDLFAYCFFQKGSKFQHIIHHIKYQNRPEIAVMLGRWYANELKREYDHLAVDLIIPVPLHASKFRSRGYNQSEEIAKGIAEVFEVPIDNEAIKRVKSNSSLTGLGKVDRIKVLQDTYVLSDSEQKKLEDKNLLIVDDIMTTGSTLIACYDAVEKAKPESISFLVLGAAQ